MSARKPIDSERAIKGRERFGGSDRAFPEPERGRFQRRVHSITAEIQKLDPEHSGLPLGAAAPCIDRRGKKVKGRMRHLVADVEGFQIKIAVREASVQDRDGASVVILGAFAAEG